MKRKLRVAILFGGQSAEHEISVVSARNIAAAMDRSKYEIVAIAIDKRGRWFLDERGALLSGNKKVASGAGLSGAAIVPGAGRSSLAHLSRAAGPVNVDLIFPVLHGPLGEDGSVQGLLKLARIPFVGAGVLGSAVGMDKDVMKRLLRDARIPIAKFLVFGRGARQSAEFARVEKSLGLPVFVKPANLGSSVGISKVASRRQFAPAVAEAFRYDNKVIIEENIAGREIECSVLGNEEPVASAPGEIATSHDFYSYDAKYVDQSGARLMIPAQLPDRLAQRIRALAVETFKVLCCTGMARVDFFLRNGRDVYVNEINTIPGFTQVSMYPKMWEASGLSYSRLIDRLIELALQQYRNEASLRTSV